MAGRNLTDVAITPLHRLLLAFPVALFPAALVADIAYLRTAEMQWSNFSAWMIAGALVFAGLAGLFSIAGLVMAVRRGQARWATLHLVTLTAAWVLGLINAFKHSQDAWSSVGVFGLMLSVLCAILILVAGWTAYMSRENVR
ncbi:DUF2231 domain-containing protein [Brevundimonas sp. SORGH_AS_0993]|uniref:DUF2231 domain-containing protein n=1 Tax=Brevundimonas sp. SORGH_AS_0993 TaxID=3041794 RepID=UPI00277E141D|nr:DUF2231 domain-containing protein [Brevundimonas sp. SORGH_AS_0993]MDQ1153106.1 putative membrane protein [Brevundimonas sp. SORGH_AS_0993]